MLRIVLGNKTKTPMTAPAIVGIMFEDDDDVGDPDGDPGGDPDGEVVFADGEDVHVAEVRVPAVHELVPDTVYPESHVGWHVDPLTRLLVQLPTAPLVGAADASQDTSSCRR